MKTIYLLVAFVVFSQLANAQDARVSQYAQMPILINPANTGNFEGSFRVTSLYNYATTDALNNNIINVGVDYKMGKQQTWALGVNYLHSGSKDFAMSEDCAGLFIAKLFYLDKEKRNALHLGAQATYISGSYSTSRGGYSPLLDVRSFYYYNPSAIGNSVPFTNNYMNFGIGIDYSYTKDNFKFESGIGATNISNPRFNIVKGNILKKRIRVAINNSFAYQYNQLNTIKVEQFSWQEGVYARKAPTQKSDSLQIQEFIYGLDFQRNTKLPYSIGLYSRSLKSAFATIGCSISSNLVGKISYELPLNKKYYNVSQFGVSLVYKGGCNKKIPIKLIPILPVATEVKPVMIHDTVYIQKTDTVKVVVDNTENLPNSKLVDLDSGLVIIYFDLKKAVLTDDSKVILDKGINYLKSKKSNIVVKGYCDDLGTESFNLQLSKQRAIAVKNYLIMKGVVASRIKMEFDGKSKNSMTDDNRWKFRKATVIEVK